MSFIIKFNIPIWLLASTKSSVLLEMVGKLVENDLLHRPTEWVVPDPQTDILLTVMHFRGRYLDELKPRSAVSDPMSLFVKI